MWTIAWRSHSAVICQVCAHLWVLPHVATWALINSDIDTRKCHDNSQSCTFPNKTESATRNNILAHGKGLGHWTFLSSVLVFNFKWKVKVVVLHELIGYTRKSRRVRCSLTWIMLQCTHILMTPHSLMLSIILSRSKCVFGMEVCIP